MLDAAKVFAGRTATWVDDRFNYCEARWLTAGFLAGRVVLIAWTPRNLHEVLPCQGSPQISPPLPRGLRR